MFSGSYPSPTSFSAPLPVCGLTTITAPTLTPTTLRSIEDSLSNSASSLYPLDEPMYHQHHYYHQHPYQASFTNSSFSPSPAMFNSAQSNSSLTMATVASDSCDSQFDSDDHSLQPVTDYSKERSQATLSDDEKRRTRRERNKLAAARCRQRRIEYTNKLSRETEDLENGNAALKNTLAIYNEQKAQLESIIRLHSTSCGINKS